MKKLFAAAFIAALSLGPGLSACDMKHSDDKAEMNTPAKGSKTALKPELKKGPRTASKKDSTSKAAKL
jgi:hypothetical protein